MLKNKTVFIVCRRDLRAVKEGQVVLVDGNAHFNRPGPRLVEALEFLVGVVSSHVTVVWSSW